MRDDIGLLEGLATTRAIRRYTDEPIPDDDLYYIETTTPEVQQQAAKQADSGAMGTGATPVPVSLPIQGRPVRFEKLLSLDETLEVSFGYRGLRK